MGHTIPQRELRNDISRVLREVRRGAELTVTVRGEPVAEMRPVGRRRRLGPGAEALAALAGLGPDPEWAAERREGREQLGYLDQL